MHLFLFTVFEYRMYHFRCGDGRGSEHHPQWNKYGLYRRIVLFPINRGDQKSLGTQGRIQDLGLGGACVGEGSGDLLRSPAGPGQIPSRGSRGTNPTPVSSGGLRNYRHLFEQF